MSPQIWIITGSSSSLGSDFVKAALDRGDKVIATAPQNATFMQGGLNDIANKAISVYGQIEVMMSNAGYTQFGTIEETSHDDWFKQFNTHDFGASNTTRSFLPHLRSNKSGTIAFIGSMVAWDGVPTVGAYCASEAAIHYAVESSKEIAAVGIKSLLFEPGTFRTDLLSQQNSKSAANKFEYYKALTESLNS
ncbi:hypothetical protein N7522_008063 [Penicillium canescens]|uniref:Uncharacterized protein n=1 Tax=Penicillium canescens TaxID=5083 RepID=A0AAD6IG28_PENCN|nr:uncharacterized protein N7446_002971 [Penicillium canescens]KAJ5996403.1 hypothetical protein N7522_008063 [Penicillium canescens]KAJ6044777.1 hypothetical protein N7460_006132 [Penicillium canescens]KAJ6075194.1 hypothetical protein N7446_002971 [Penicillium canescens]KAJ6175797.1 hypothetical protein N7485_002711 [Penicillium canescens]